MIRHNLEQIVRYYSKKVGEGSGAGGVASRAPELGAGVGVGSENSKKNKGDPGPYVNAVGAEQLGAVGEGLQLRLRKGSEEWEANNRLKVKRSFLFPKSKGIIKIKLGAVFTQREKLPDDYQCFLLQLESIFPCLSPNFKHPRKGSEPSEFAPPCMKLYDIFYLDKNDEHVSLQKEAAYLHFMFLINHDASLPHPLYGIRVIVVPKEGDAFLERHSLAGEHEVELDEQMWKLLFVPPPPPPLEQPPPAEQIYAK